MYIMLTDKCQYECEHCCFRCSPENNEFMNKRVFKRALKLAINLNTNSVTLGGGEPTLHPHFLEYFMLAVGCRIDGVEYVTVISNGAPGTYEKLKCIAPLACENIYVAASKSDFKPFVDPYVEHLVKKFNLPWHGPTDASQVFPVGRAEDNYLSDQEGCPCNDLLVKPNGDVYFCAHEDIYLGTVFKFKHNYYNGLVERYEDHCSRGRRWSHE